MQNIHPSKSRMSSEQNQESFKRHKDIDKLIKLQRLDANLARLSGIIFKTIPSQIKELEDNFTRDQGKLESFDENTAKLKKRKKELEAEVEDTKGKIAKAKLKLTEVKTNVEYRAILKETENFETRISKIDDEQLDLMEKMEDLASQRPAILKQVDEDREKLNNLKAEKEKELKVFRQELEDDKARREEVVSTITPGILANYEKIRSIRKGVGIAQAKDNTCMGCYQIIQPQLYYLIRTSGEINKCPHCNRYLYHIPEPKKEEEKPAGEGADEAKEE